MTEQSLVASEDYIQFCHGRLADPYPFFDRLMAEDPVHWSELLDVWVITRYDYVSFRACGPVGVGIAVARDPLRRSGQALLTHQMFSTTFDAQCAEVKDVAKLF